MAPLRFTYQFLTIVFAIGGVIGLFDHGLLSRHNTAALANAPSLQQPPIQRAPIVAKTQAAPNFAEGGLPDRKMTTLTGVLHASQSAFNLPPFDAPLLLARERGQAPRTWVSGDRPTKLRTAYLETQRALGFVPSPLSRPRPAPQQADGQFIAAIPANRPKVNATVLRFNQAGYDALAAGNSSAALAAFSSSLERRPNQPLIHSQMGYIYKSEGKMVAASNAFNQSLAYTPESAQSPGLVREANALSRRVRLNAYTVWRQDSQPEADISFGPSLAQSQSGIGAGYRLPVNGWAGRQDLTLYARMLWAYQPMSIALNDESFQGGVGIQVRPIEGINLVAAAERLIAFGDFARDDWLLRASYSAGQGYAPLDRERSWLHWSLYSDVAIIDPADPDLQITGEGRIGFGQRPFDASSFTVIPFAAVTANFQDAAGVSTTLYEAGAGIWMRYWPGGADLTDPQRALDLRVEYRGKVGGDSASTSGLRVTLGLNY